MPVPRDPGLHWRQNDDDTTTGSVPSSYGAMDSSPSPGAVVGIVLGSVAGFILVIWLIYTCLNFGPAAEESSTYAPTGSVLTLRSRRSRPRRRSRSRTRVTETVEVRTRERGGGGGGGPRRSGGPAPIIVDAEPESDSDRVYVERRPSRGSRMPPPRVVSAMSDSDDEVVVIEEHSPPPRRASRRRSPSQVRRSSVYRDEYDRRSSRRMSRHS